MSENISNGEKGDSLANQSFTLQPESKMQGVVTSKKCFSGEVTYGPGSTKMIYAQKAINLVSSSINLTTETESGCGVFLNGKLFNPHLTTDTSDTIMIGAEGKTYKNAWIGGVDVIALYHCIGELEDKLNHVLTYFEEINPQ